MIQLPIFQIWCFLILNTLQLDFLTLSHSILILPTFKVFIFWSFNNLHKHKYGYVLSLSLFFPLSLSTCKYFQNSSCEDFKGINETSTQDLLECLLATHTWKVISRGIFSGSIWIWTTSNSHQSIYVERFTISRLLELFNLKLTISFHITF